MRYRISYILSTEDGIEERELRRLAHFAKDHLDADSEGDVTVNLESIATEVTDWKQLGI